MAQQTFEYYEELFNSYSDDFIGSRTEKSSKNNGSLGEFEVFSVLRRFSNKIYKNVVLWNKKHTFTTEIDFIVELNGFLVLVEVKDWYGKMYLGKDTEHVNVVQVGFDGRRRASQRVSPRFAIAAYADDLARYLKPTIKSKACMKKIVVFSRDDFKVVEDRVSSTVYCHCYDLEYHLQNIKNETNEDPVSIAKPLPGWDYYLDSRGTWYRTMVKNESIETKDGIFMVKDISEIVFDDEDYNKVLIKLKDGSTISTETDSSKILLNDVNMNVKKYFRFLKFNDLIHESY